MLRFLIIACVLLVPVGSLLIASRGCENVFSPPAEDYAERDDAEFVRARDLVSAGRGAEATEIFQRLIRHHPDAAVESNFEVGQLAFAQGDYPLAIYHFNRYLALRPDASREVRERALGRIRSAKKEMAKEMFPALVAGTDSSANASADLDKKYLEVKQQNDALKREITALRERLAQAEKAASAPRSPAVGVPAPAETATESVASENVPASPPTPPEPKKPPVPATHTVAQGETLSAISKKYYGTSARWREIYEANRVTMSSPDALKPGMVIKLPRP